MIELDGAALDMSGREFTYEVPAPFGPKRGAAVLKISAKPAASVNSEFRNALEGVMHQARVRDAIADDMFKESKDYSAYYEAQAKNTKWVNREIAQLNYDHCIVAWSTTIQNAGQDLEPTRDNFIELSMFQHPVIERLFKAIQKDLADHEKFSLDATKAVEAAEVKN